MPFTEGLGHRAGQASGPHLYDAAGQILFSVAAGRTAVLAAPTVAGQPLVAASGLPSWGNPSGAAAVAADVTHTQSNTTLSDVTGLLVPIGASATEAWLFKAYLKVTATTGAVDLKLGWTVPTSATMSWGSFATASTAGLSGFAPVGTAGTPIGLVDQTGTISVGTANTTTGVGILGWIYGGGTAGNVQLQFAQDTSSATNLTIAKASEIEYRRLIA